MQFNNLFNLISSAELGYLSFIKESGKIFIFNVFKKRNWFKKHF